MCGIAGVAYADGKRPVDQAMLAGMAGLMMHRGPDSDGYFSAPGVGFAVRRLSIIDLAGGDQPIANDDGTLTLICKGEIYNDTFPSGSALASSRCGSSNRSPDQPQGALPQIGALRPALTTDRSTRLVWTRPASPSLAKLAPHLRLPIQNRSVQLDAVKVVKRYLASRK